MKYTNCPNPNCGAAWGIEEMSFQECDTCNYPNVEEEEDFDNYGEDDDDNVFRALHETDLDN